MPQHRDARLLVIFIRHFFFLSFSNIFYQIHLITSAVVCQHEATAHLGQSNHLQRPLTNKLILHSKDSSFSLVVNFLPIMMLLTNLHVKKVTKSPFCRIFFVTSILQKTLLKCSPSHTANKHVTKFTRLLLK